jgi:hypothetical protein
MKRFIIILTSIVLTTLYCVNCKQSSKSSFDKKKEYTDEVCQKNIIDSFFVMYETVGFEEAIYNLFESNHDVTYNRTELLNVVTLFNETSNFIGEYCGYEFICGSWIGNSLILYSYMVKYKVQPLKFTFIFYKAKDRWAIQNFNFDNSLIQELKETAEFYTTKGELKFYE